jgi:hypothetical protein
MGPLRHPLSASRITAFRLRCPLALERVVDAIVCGIMIPHMMPLPEHNLCQNAEATRTAAFSSMN